MLDSIWSFGAATIEYWWVIITGLAVPMIFDVPDLFGSETFRKKWMAARKNIYIHARMGGAAALLIAAFLAYHGERAEHENTKAQLAQIAESITAKKIDQLEKALSSYQAWSITDQQKEALHKVIAEAEEISPLLILPMGNHYPADSFGHDLLVVFRDAGWKNTIWTAGNYVPPNTKGMYVAVPSGTDLSNPPPEAVRLDKILRDTGFPMKPIGSDTTLNNQRICQSSCIGVVIGEREP
ncbi:MAG: hypothetical protein ISR44_03705 [Rhodospirillales bacterium]|nr:hypothetical protein [Rhodospirillales bacterium]